MVLLYRLAAAEGRLATTDEEAAKFALGGWSQKAEASLNAGVDFWGIFLLGKGTGEQIS